MRAEALMGKERKILNCKNRLRIRCPYFVFLFVKNNKNQIMIDHKNNNNPKYLPSLFFFL